MEIAPTDSDKNKDDVKNVTFKKPVLIGKIGRLPRKTTSINVPPVHETLSEDVPITSDGTEKKEKENLPTSTTVTSNQDESAEVSESQGKEQQNVSLSYKEPPWSGLPVANMDYKFEVLKSGVIIETVNLMKKPFWVFGRLPACDMYMAHPTISRYHAVLQYNMVETEDRPVGFYIYDLGSTHGTFLNKSRIKSKMYVRIQVGHMLKLGCSTRTYLLLGPEEDTESEAELSVTELKEKRAQELKLREEQELREIQEREEQKKKEEERGIDWGMGEDADEETDLTENPYAETNNEQLYIEDPKKALRGFMEREGCELHYEITERGIGQFLCSVTLPLDDARGRPLVAEALVKGKKKEAVVQCALEACRILDRHGVLRQATHESKKRKAKNWEENDYYDSDEDTFLDRTGTIERKRERRMKAKQPQQPETYQTLVSKEENLNSRIQQIEEQLTKLARGDGKKSSEDAEEDSLDHFMNELHTHKPDKFTVAKLKTELSELKKEHTETIRLVNIARPADLPPLVINTSSASGSSNVASTSGVKSPQKKSLPMFGKRLKVKVMLPPREVPDNFYKNSAANQEEQEEEEDEEENDGEEKVRDDHKKDENTNVEVSAATSLAEESETQENQAEEEQEEEEEMFETRKGIIKQLKVSLCDEKVLTSLHSTVKNKISKTVTKLRKIAEEEERIVVDEKRLAVQKKKIFEQMDKADSSDIVKHFQLSHALNKMTTEFCTIGDRKLKIVAKINKLADDINNIAIEIQSAYKFQHEKAVNRMKEFVEKAHKQQTEIFKELKKLESSVADNEVIEKLKELYEWLSSQKTNMLENLDKLKNVKLTEDSKLLEDIIEFEVKSDKFITTILEEIRKIRTDSEKLNTEKAKSPPKKMKLDVQSTSGNASREESSDDEEVEKSTDIERKRKKNLRRIIQRQEKAEVERKKQYEEDALKENYNMWVPPEGQTGDGRTNLNDKFGY